MAQTLNITKRMRIVLHFDIRFLNSEVQGMFAELDVQLSEQETINAIKTCIRARVADTIDYYE